MDKSDVARIYKRLRTNYGTAFTRSFPADVIDHWFEDLRKFNLMQADHAIDNWIKENPDRYPNLPQLCAMMRRGGQVQPITTDDGPEPYTPEWYRQRKKNREVGQRFIKELRRRLEHARSFTPEETREMATALREDNLRTVRELLDRVGADMPPEKAE